MGSGGTWIKILGVPNYFLYLLKPFSYSDSCMHFSISNISKSLNSSNIGILIYIPIQVYPTNSLCAVEFVMQPKIYP